MSAYAEAWRPAPLELSFPRDRIDVWRVELDSGESEGKVSWDVLAPEEIARAERFYFARDRQRFAKCRMALRDIIGRYLEIEPAEIRFHYDKNGKPEIVDTQNSSGLRFNVSHSFGLAVIAVSAGRAIGVDIERIDREIDCLEIAHRFFSERECRALLAIPASERQRAFFSCWTRKEAFLKATGEGISYRLADFSVSMAPDVPPVIEEALADPRAVLRWSLANLRPGDGYLGTLAFEAAPCLIDRWCWKTDTPHS